ncbi:cell wall hydrolase [Fontibacillus sp. BL9]|uniref:cell wall hydrolase n=1 Tax=Fontibacillus sp. BL9 TaxID=3389971 RepID=UPI00397A797D
MYIFRQNRYVALLVGAILVCLGAICLLGQNSEPESKGNRQFSQSRQNLLKADLAAKTVSFAQSGAATQNERLGKQFLPFLNTLELKKQSLDTGISSSEQLHELAAEVIWLRNQAAQTITEPAPDKFNPPTQLFFTRTELLSHEDKEEATWTYALNEEELLLLQKIVMAEAEGEPYEGKVAVANVVLNRLRSANYPDTIKDVIYQKSQFSPVRNGRLKKVKPSKDTIHAVNEALNGRKEVSDDTYYFLSLKLAKDLTIARTKDKAHVIGNHTFYK